ncbi:MAG: hypothetical protein FJW30_01150 [Acidobacteria bacterium]|nr:hypothetical protein [Acidobacteriota bacterium]
MKYFVLAAIVLLNIACVTPFRRAKAAPPPPGPMPARIPDVITTSDSPPPPRNLPQPPAVPITVPDPATAEVVTAQERLPPAPPRPRPRRRAQQVASAKPAPIEVETPGPPPFQLGEVTTPARREELLRQADAALAICAKALAAVEGKRLRSAQINMVARIRRFSEEARSLIEKDPVRARNLAIRGRAFADALLGELKP